MTSRFIIQPGRIGDLIILSGIARYYASKGDEVVWAIWKDFVSHANRILPNETSIFPVTGNTVEDSVLHAREAYAKAFKDYEVLDLTCGFWSSDPANEADWVASGLTFDEWKYNKADVPFEMRYGFTPKLDQRLTDRVWSESGVSKGDKFILVHDEHSMGSVTFDTSLIDLPVVKVKQIPGVTLIDWLPLAQEATACVCVDSAFSNLLNCTGTAIGKRHVRPKYEQFGSIMVSHGYQRFPQYAKDWIIL